MVKQSSDKRKNIKMLKRIGITQLTGQKLHQEIERRKHCARLWCNHHWRILTHNHFKRTLKFQLYKFLVRPILTYGCEFWILDDKSASNLLQFEYAILSEIYKSKYPSGHPKRANISTKSVFARYRTSDIVNHVRFERLRWDELLSGEETFMEENQSQVQWWDRC